MPSVDFSIRDAVADDQPFLTLMLLAAADWRPASPAHTVDDLMNVPELARYVEGWPKTGDCGVIALDGGGTPVGAAWWRTFPADQPGYGFVACAVPEISIAVAESLRGRGIGSRLLRELIVRAARAGLQALSLSVERDNPAVRLYAREGFVDLRTVGGAVTMVRSISQ